MTTRPPQRIPSLPERLHFVGIGGIGMSALAQLLLKRGHQISGSDSQVSSNTERLAQLGCHVRLGHDPSDLREGTAVVLSSAIRPDNPEVRRAVDLGLVLLHRSDVLKAFLDERFAITIAGTHGKTTTTCLIAHMLRELGQAPGFAAGGRMLDSSLPAADLGGRAFVAEVDESDGTLSKYSTDIAVVTNIEPDHLDHFGTFDRMKDLFKTHLMALRKDGMAILGWDDPVCRELRVANKLGYGFVIGSDVRGLSYECFEGFVKFDAMVERERVRCRLPQIGKHNVQNALAALAVARALELNVKAAAESLESFPGVARRMACYFSSEQVKVYDDYAHNPGKITCALDSAKESFKKWTITAIFQPHRFSRLTTMYEAMLDAVGRADEVLVLPVYAAGEPDDPQLTPSRIASAITARTGTKARPFKNFDEVTSHVVKSGLTKNIIITVGAGDVWKVAETLRNELS